MLVLTRRSDEEIVIGGNIYVRVLGIKGRQVRLGITAPVSVAVARSELREGPVSRTVTAGDATGPTEMSVKPG